MHAAAQDSFERSKAAEIAREIKRAVGELTGSLTAFCDRWVPSGADAEKLTILRQLNELGGVGRQAERAVGRN